MTHTPGPWTVEPLSRTSRQLSIIPHYDDHDRRSVASVIPTSGDPPMDVEANAKLIAAAPDLLKALEAAGELWSWLPFDSGDDIQRVANRIAKLQRAAIEAAK